MSRPLTKMQEIRRRFHETYGFTTIEVDYGSAQALADAHRKYIAKMRRRMAEREAPRLRSVVTWMEVYRATLPDGSGVPQLVPYPPPQQQPPINSMQFEAAGFTRRFIAEVIDFAIVLILKLGIIALLLDHDLIDLTSYGASLEEDQDVMQFINLAQDLLPLEMACKVVCCIIEGIFMSQRVLNFGIGQTPGKYMMGIRVISVKDVTSAEIPNHIIVQEPELLTLPQALKRSFLKNVIVNSLFPLSTAAFQVHNGRVFYDCLVGTCVVIDI
ncbi:hypothetical protein CAEBREN_00277 [Caenorhabditis brenneri]|uniref:RDD domain-containing protein n=1 Tax=Caenorhabditis brenneri TaxID=135651 RepID=G0M7B1_CAEBE|nr:hypothetical protein CAEBREN_00277 [Caenorhabditis brenneri]